MPVDKGKSSPEKEISDVSHWEKKGLHIENRDLEGASQIGEKEYSILSFSRVILSWFGL